MTPLPPTYNSNCAGSNVQPLHFDPDIAGLGVLLGFMMTGFVALILSTTTAILGHIGSWRIRPFRQRLCEDPEPLETLRRRQKQCEALESLILNLSDQQLVTSFILLILAYTKYVAPSIYLDPARSSIACNSSIANLLFTGDLVFYSSVTHATTLITLRAYLKKRVLQTILRILVVHFTFGMWLAIKITGYSVNFPRFGDLPTTAKFQQVTNVCEVVGLAIVYLDIFIPFSTDLLLSLQNYMRVKRSFNTIKDWAEFSSSFRNHKFRHRAFLPRCLILLWVLFGISSVNLLLDENYQPQVFTMWGFGQLLSICLLILPFFTLAEKLEDLHTTKCHENDEDDEEKRAILPRVPMNSVETLVLERYRN